MIDKYHCAADGILLVEDVRMALCRYGGSGNKPFCDGTHRRIGFRSMEASHEQ